MLYFLQDKTWKNNQTSSVLRNNSIFSSMKNWPLDIYFTEGSTKARVKVKRTSWPLDFKIKYPNA